MKKCLKVIAFVSLIFLLISSMLIICFFQTTSSFNLDEEKLIDLDRKIIYLDRFKNQVLEQSNGREIANIEEIPLHVQNAFISVEDKRFYSHNGIDFKGLLRASIKNLASFSFKEGASTISQQLIKNTHLSNEKKLKRKLVEIKLSLQLEKKYSKKEILESYLNTIYFGEGCYGIASASRHYFDKKTSELTVEEGAILAGIINAPSRFSPFNDLYKCNDRKKIVLNRMFEQGFINGEQHNVFTSNLYKFENVVNKNYNFIDLVSKENSELLDKIPYSSSKFYIDTTLEPSLQEKIIDVFDSYDTKTDKSITVLNPKGEILAFCASCALKNRQVGSTLKPLSVYCPAIEKGMVDSCSFINDEPININGYSPKNYNDVYNGEISVKSSLAKSSNVCAIKLISQLGPDVSVNYLKKMDLGITEKDKNLSLGLGCTYNGCSLVDITGAYLPFINNGFYSKPFSTKKVKLDNHNVIYNNKSAAVKIFNQDTVEIVRDMLGYCVENGTARNLKSVGIKLYSKTGTVGTENGNTDAYCISFNKDYIIGVWLGNKDGEIMENSITGGTLPTKISASIWQEIYKEKNVPSDFEILEAQKIDIDKNEYQQNKKIVLADKNAPNSCVITELFVKNRTLSERSNLYSSPKLSNIETLVESNRITIRLCVPQYIDYIIYKSINKKKIKIYDSFSSKDKSVFIDQNIKQNTLYEYTLIPYYRCKNNIFYGNEIYLGKIKTPTMDVGENWWKEIL